MTALNGLDPCAAEKLPRAWHGDAPRPEEAPEGGEEHSEDHEGDEDGRRVEASPSPKRHHPGPTVRATDGRGSSAHREDHRRIGTPADGGPSAAPSRAGRDDLEPRSVRQLQLEHESAPRRRTCAKTTISTTTSRCRRSAARVPSTSGAGAWTLSSTWDELLDNLKFERAAEVSVNLANRYARGELDAVYLCYNEFKSAISQKAVVQQLLPVKPLDGWGGAGGGPHRRARFRFR